MNISENTGSEFKVFDATGFRGKPNMIKFGIRPMDIIYTNDLWKTKRNKNNRWDFVNRSLTEKEAHKAARPKGRAVMVSLHNWKTNRDEKTTHKSVMRYSWLYHAFKKSEPNINFGYFNALPVKNWWRNDPTQKQLDNWKKMNDRLKPLAKKVDVFYLKGYAKSTDQHRWAANMKLLIKEAKRIGGGQPIYLVLWPQYDGKRHKNLKGKYIEKDFWQRQLQLAKKYADGVVLFAPHKTPWDESAPWWGVTKKFMEDLGQYSSKPKVSNSNFKVFDGTRFPNTPNMKQLGFDPLEIIYSVRLWDKPLHDVGKWELPSKRLVEKWTDKAHEINKRTVMFDIERWPTEGSDAKASIKNYSTVYNWAKQQRSDMKVGYFKTVPDEIHWRKYPQKKWMKSAQKHNNQLEPLANKVDTFFPHAYTYTRDKKGWLIKAKYTLKLANEHSGNKPVYLVLWPQYKGKVHPNLKGKYIGKDFWELQLETARRYADGVVIWFPKKVKWSNAKRGPWWNVTKKFLQDLGKAN